MIHIHLIKFLSYFALFVILFIIINLSSGYCLIPLQTKPSKLCGLRYTNNAIAKRAMPQIVGGTESAINSWPWQIDIRIYNGTNHLCGGTLISQDIVITAAHCFPSSLSKEKYYLYGGIHNFQISDSRRQLRTDYTVTIHPSFSKIAPFDSDLAIIKLAKPFELNNYVNIICLPEKEPKPCLTTPSCIITGWGDTRGTAIKNVLNEVNVQLIDLAKCNSSEYLAGRITENMICAGYDMGGKDACSGDSGGPLMCQYDGKWYLEGVISWGINCATAKKPGVYTKIYNFLPYIQSFMH